MAQITDLASLRSQVKTNLVRSSVGDSDVDGWVQLVEARLNYGVKDGRYASPALRARKMRYTDPAFTVDDEFVNLPDDYLSPVVMRDTATQGGQGDGIFVDIVSAPQVCGTDLGRPGAFKYVVIHGLQAQFAPFPQTDDFTLQFTYYQQLLSLLNGTNWLVTDAPGVYLYGCLVEAYIQYRNDKETMKYLEQFSGLVRGLNAAEQQALYAPGQRAYSDVIPGGYGGFVRG